MPFIAGAAMAVIVVLVLVHRVEAAGAIALLLAPWVLLCAVLPFNSPWRASGADTIDAVAFGVLAAWLVVQWIYDAPKVSTPVTDSP